MGGDESLWSKTPSFSPLAMMHCSGGVQYKQIFFSYHACHGVTCVKYELKCNAPISWNQRKFVEPVDEKNWKAAECKI